MTAHNHAAYLEGCFRCDLSRDEPLPVADVEVPELHSRNPFYDPNVLREIPASPDG